MIWFFIFSQIIRNNIWVLWMWTCKTEHHIMNICFLLHSFRKVPLHDTEYYLAEIPDLSKYGLLFVEDGLIITCFDLFAAGAESVSNTLSFTVLYTVLYPEVQRKVQNMLDDVVGRDRRPHLDDRPRYETKA